MPDTKPRRDPLASAPTSQEIISGARRRNQSQHTCVPSKAVTATQDKPKATFYLTASLVKTLKRYALEQETTQSQVVESAILEYMDRHPTRSA